MFRSATPAAGLVLAAVLAGCNPPRTSNATFRLEGHGHSHDRGKLMLADAGPYHAALTAHLSSQDGNELDLFFETAGKDPKPAPLPLDRVTATARMADGAEHPLAFDPAPADERKDDPAGACSHFVAKAGWMKPDDVLTVTATVEIDGKPRLIEWKDFHPKKYAHHVE